jgi:murein L,D-transpeptidase YafK
MLKKYLSLKPFLIVWLGFCLCLIIACTSKKPRKKLVIKPLITETAEIHQSDKEWIKKPSIWLLIDTQKKQLAVKRGNRTLVTFDNIAIGRRGAGFKRQRGDKITPLGTYKIGWINPNSSFRTFYGFTYPSVENAKKALANDLISKSIYRSIINAHKNHKIPPQNTPLGGRIGLHGLGSSNPKIHQMWDWTKGCVAVTNQQIDELSNWIVKGMTVKVK